MIGPGNTRIEKFLVAIIAFTVTNVPLIRSRADIRTDFWPHDTPNAAAASNTLPSAMRMLSNSSWNVVAVHNHVIGESPSMIFVHAIANGDINTLTKDTRTILDSLMAQMQSSFSNQTSTTGGGTTGGNMASNSTPGGVTGGTTTDSGSTAGGGVGTFGGGGSGGTTTGGAAGPQVMP